MLVISAFVIGANFSIARPGRIIKGLSGSILQSNALLLELRYVIAVCHIIISLLEDKELCGG